MTKLKLTTVDDEKPVKIAVTLPAALHRNLVAYAEILAYESGKVVEPAKLIAPMLDKFIAGDRGFRKARKVDRKLSQKPSPTPPESAPPTSTAPD